MEQFVNVLPENFDGRWFFTNWSDEEFIGRWDGKGYKYPPKSTTQMVILNASPIETQNIRKKFAKELAEREVFKTEKFKKLEKEERPQGFAVHSSFQSAGQYSLDDLKDLIQRCLEPLAVGEALMQELPKENTEENLRRDEDGDFISQVASQGQRLRTKENVRPQL